MWVRENIRPLLETGTLLIVGEDITETRQLADQLAYQARYDSLTHTLNRNQFELELAKALKETESQLRTHAMLYLNLDQLKVLNDTAGHDARVMVLFSFVPVCWKMYYRLEPRWHVWAAMSSPFYCAIVPSEMPCW